LNDILGAGLITDQHQGKPDEPSRMLPVQVADGVRAGQLLRPCRNLGEAGNHIYKMPLAADC
jgi:hypothetical protein